jgi:hypothetical protein
VTREFFCRLLRDAYYRAQRELTISSISLPNRYELYSMETLEPVRQNCRRDVSSDRRSGIHCVSGLVAEDGDSRAMEVDELIAVLEGDGDLMSVVGLLGQDCLDQREAVENDRYAAIADMILKLRDLAADESTLMWGVDGARCAAPSLTLKERLAKTRATPSLATIIVLEGICVGAARLFFANASSVVLIEHGAILPLPERWLADIPTTPHPGTTHPNLLDEQCNFVLWELAWKVELDYTFRDRLDLVCAVRLPSKDKSHAKDGKTRLAYKLPKIATVHPFGGHAMTLPEWDHPRQRFFFVRPKLPSHGPGMSQAQASAADEVSRAQAHQQVFDALAKAGEIAPIAVLPEFCLHSPDGLDTLIANSTGPIADLVVAGSAHTVDAAGIRANTSHVLLDGQPILRVSKHEPFVLRGGDGVNYVEDIAPSSRVLSLAAGTATRLAVAICSDLNSFDLLAAMTAAGVNLLLSPSWTPKIGGADKGLQTLAGYCLCVGVIANTPGHSLAKKGDKQFCACSVVPRETEAAHFHNYVGALPVVGVLDPNLEPTKPGSWLWRCQTVSSSDS